MFKEINMRRKGDIGFAGEKLFYYILFCCRSTLEMRCVLLALLQCPVGTFGDDVQQVCGPVSFV